MSLFWSEWLDEDDNEAVNRFWADMGRPFVRVSMGSALPAEQHDEDPFARVDEAAERELMARENERRWAQRQYEESFAATLADVRELPEVTS